MSCSGGPPPKIGGKRRGGVLPEEFKKTVSVAAMGGRRRKTHRMRGGNGYGFVATPASVINAGNFAYTPNMTSVPSGQPVIGSLNGGRRRKSRKGRKSRKSRRRTMRGGGSVAGVGYGFTGTGARGIADAVAYPSNVPPAAFPIPTGTR